MIRRETIDGRSSLTDPSRRAIGNEVIRATESNALSTGDPRVNITRTAGGTRISLAPDPPPDAKVFRMDGEMTEDTAYAFTEMTEDGFSEVVGGLTEDFISPGDMKFLTGFDVSGGAGVHQAYTPYLTGMAVYAQRQKMGNGNPLNWYINAPLGRRTVDGSIEGWFDMLATTWDPDLKYWGMDTHKGAIFGSDAAGDDVSGVLSQRVTRLRLSSSDNLIYMYTRSDKYDSMGHLWDTTVETKESVSRQGTLFIVSVAQTGGAAGTASTQCDWEYTVTGLGGETYGTGMEPDWQRPPLGAVVAGSGYVGIGYYTGKDTSSSSATFHLLSAGEVPDSAAC